MRSDSLAASMSVYLRDEIAAAANVDVQYRTQVVGGGGKGRLDHLVLRDVDSGEGRTVDAGGLFILIGARPRTDWLPAAVARDDAGYVLVGADDRLASIARRVSDLGYPLVLKPDDQGSSVGVTIARDSAELPIALAKSRRFGGSVLAETLVIGREFTVAMLDDRPLPLIEIVSPEPVFSYDAKYNSSLTEYKFDFALDDASRGAIEQAAIGAVRALGATGLTRVDVMLDRQASPWVLEVNTIPGMTARSLAPLAAARAGLEMPSLCDHLVKRCLAAAGVA